MWTDPEWPTQQILDEIKAKALWAEKNPGFVIQPFSALLVRLSRESEATAKAVNDKTSDLIKLTRVLIIMTAALIVLTVPLVIIETTKFVSEVFQVPLHPPQHANNSDKNQQHPETAKKPDNAEPASGVQPVNKPAVEAVAPPAIEAPQKKEE